MTTITEAHAVTAATCALWWQDQSTGLDSRKCTSPAMVGISGNRQCAAHWMRHCICRNCREKVSACSCHDQDGLPALPPVYLWDRDTTRPGAPWQVITRATAPAAKVQAADQLEVEKRKAALRIDALARQELAAENAPPVPAAFGGRDFLRQPDNPVIYRIAGLMPVGSNVLLAAQYKAGKTTLTGNLVRTWCDGVPFLGAYEFTPTGKPVMVIDVEMNADTARRWLRAHGIVNTAGFRYVSLRGAAGSLNPLSAASRRQWAGIIRGCSAVILDPLGPLLGALGLDESSNQDVVRFLAAWDQLMADAGVSESFVIHHMGHSAERTRGASRLRDWPDVEWRMMRQDDDPRSPRYFTAYGRDVDVPEVKLIHDPETRHLTAGEGTRKKAAAAAIGAALADLLTTSPGLSGNQIELAIGQQFARSAIRAGIAAMVKSGEMEMQAGPRNSRLHYLTSPVRRTSPQRTGEVASSSSPPYINGELARSLASSTSGEDPGEVRPEHGCAFETPEGPCGYPIRADRKYCALHGGAA